MKDVERESSVQFHQNTARAKKIYDSDHEQEKSGRVKKGTQDGSKMYSSRSTTRTLRVRIHAVEAVWQPHLYFSKRVYVLRIRTPLTFPHTVVWLR